MVTSLLAHGLSSLSFVLGVLASSAACYRGHKFEIYWRSGSTENKRCPLQSHPNESQMETMSAWEFVSSNITNTSDSNVNSSRRSTAQTVWRILSPVAL